jgi:hypothetical protein
MDAPGRSALKPACLSASLYVAHASADLAVLGISGGVPESGGRRILVSDQGSDSASALAAQVHLAGADERHTDPLTAMGGEDRKPIHVSPPMVPSGDQSS